MKTIILNSAFALALAVGGAGSASAQPDVDVLGQRIDPDAMSVRVSFADLNLASADGRSQLTTRVVGAVRQVCSPFDEKGRWVEHVECRSVAWNGARPQMDRAFARAQQAALGGAVDTAVATITISAPTAL